MNNYITVKTIIAAESMYWFQMSRVTCHILHVILYFMSQLDPNVIRIPIIPGSDPRIAYGNLVERGVKGVVLEAFGVGNMPDIQKHG